MVWGSPPTRVMLDLVEIGATVCNYKKTNKGPFYAERERERELEPIKVTMQSAAFTVLYGSNKIPLGPRLYMHVLLSSCFTV
jgi:hypothetical protein